MDTRGFTSQPLRWFVDYGCRDDYGTTLDTTSAWAGLHYFCSRETEASLVWGDGLGTVIRNMAQALAADGVEIRTSSLVHRIEQSGGTATVEYVDLRDNSSRVVRARKVIFAAPHHTARHIISGYAQQERVHDAECGVEGCLNFTYAPWAVANVFLKRPPPTPWNWEQMAYRPNATGFSRQGLGYVFSPSEIQRWSASWWSPMSWPWQWKWNGGAAAQRSETVLTAYFVLSESVGNLPHEWLNKSWEDWRDDVLDSLRMTIPTIDELSYKVDVRVLAHAMNRPVPGFLWGPRSPRKLAQRPFGAVHFAHSDHSGLSLFEEAVTREYGHEKLHDFRNISNGSLVITEGFRAATEVAAEVADEVTISN